MKSFLDRYLYRLFLLCSLLVVPFGALGLAQENQDTSRFLAGLSIEELLDLRVTTASVLDTPWIRQPASISIINSTSIENTAFRYLEDILETVPGTSFGIDVFGVTSLNFRGHWAHEGKVLLLVDGFPMNDMYYGGINLQRHYPASQIQSVEILRGAGTAKYGENAQLAVVRVSTLPEDFEGVRLQASGNWIRGAGWGHQQTISGAYQLASEDMTVSFTAHQSTSPFSGEQWLDSFGDSVDLDDLTELNTWNAAFRFEWKALNLQLMHDSHDSQTPHGFGFARYGERISFENTSFMASYGIELSDRWQLSPSVMHRYQEDWHIDRDPAIQPDVKDFFLNASETKVSLDATYDGDKLDLRTGIEWWKEHGFAESPGGVASDASTYFAGSRSVDYHGNSAYMQADWQSAEWMSSAGLRYSDHEYAGSSLVPRFTLGFIEDDWYLKLNAGQAFREPDIEVINSSNWGQPAIESERTTSVDLEWGRNFSKSGHLTATVFYVKIQDPIIYTSATGGNESYYYFNNAEVATWGFESEIRYRNERSLYRASYSFYNTLDQPIDIYRVPGNSNVHVGVPTHKFVINFNHQLSRDGWSFESSAIAYFQTYGWVYDETTVDFQGYNLGIRKLDDALFVHIGIKYERKNWTWRMQAFDLLDSVREYVQPYHSESTPYPGAGREVVISFSWKW